MRAEHQLLGSSSLSLSFYLSISLSIYLSIYLSLGFRIMSACSFYRFTVIRGLGKQAYEFSKPDPIWGYDT